MKNKKIFSGLIALAILISGCSANINTTETQASETPEVTAESTSVEAATTSETTIEAEPFKFNPHVHTDLISEVFKDEWWESFYNMCDAMREGKDTFECIDEECFKACTHEVFIGSLFPAACSVVVGDGYENGTGRLKYKMDKDKFLERQAAFEKEIERMLNEAIRTDYSEFEKVMGLYDYMCKNFRYDYEPLDGQGIDDFSDYACLTKKNGICCEFAGAYSYLLLQAGVDATPFEGDGEAGYHGWTYVVVGGKGYHCDATWGAHGENPDTRLTLQYFMMTEEERIKDNFNKETLRPDLIWPFVEKITGDFSATDETFKPFHNYLYFVEMDTVRNVVVFEEFRGERFELNYGNL